LKSLLTENKVIQVPEVGKMGDIKSGTAVFKFERLTNYKEAREKWK